jgi:tetratricopeptide (TPR) repeat protein
MRFGLSASFVVAAVACAAAVADPPDSVDRARLKKIVRPPDVVIRFRYSLSATSYEETEGGAPAVSDVAALRAELKDDDGDAERWGAIAAAYRAAGDTQHERESRQKSIAYYRRRAAEKADDGGAYASLAVALAAAGDDAGADAAIESAVHAPRDASKGWAAGGDLCVLRAFGLLTGRQFLDVFEAMTWLAKSPRTVGDPAAAERLLVAAGKRYDEAVRLAPDDAEVRMKRFLVRGVRALSPGGGPDDAGDLDDVRKIVALRPNDPRAVAVGAMFEWGLALRDDKSAAERTLSDCPEKARATIEGALSRLAAPAASADPSVAAPALEARAVILYMVHDETAAESSVRKALSLDPRRRDSWALLAGMLKKAERWKDLAKVCRDSIAVRDTTLKRLVLASALDRAGDPAAAEAQWRAALALDAKSYEANVGVASAVLRRDATSAELGVVVERLTDAGAAWRADGGSDAKRGLELSVDAAVCVAFMGDVDRAERDARRILKDDPSSGDAKEILAAIGR